MPSTSAWRVFAAITALALLAAGLSARDAAADHTPIPSTVTLVGSLQSELGCPGDWQPECADTRLQPVAGQEGVFAATFDVPAGSFEYKVALNGTWDENYGAGGVLNGANLALAAPGGPVTFTYDHGTHLITDTAPVQLNDAQWLTRETIALDLPDERAGFSYRLFWAAEGGIRREGTAVVGGTSAPLTLTGGLSPQLLARYPHLKNYETLRVPAGVRVPQILTGQVAVAVYAGDGGLVALTKTQIPGVLDDLYRGAQQRILGPTWRGKRPTLALWAPTAKSVSLLITAPGSAVERTVAMVRDRDGVWSARGHRSWRNAEYRFAVRVYVPSLDEVVVNEVTDPYSLGLTTNSQRSLLVDLADRRLKPAGLGPAAQAAAERTGEFHHLRAAPARLLDRRCHRPGGAPGHLPGVHPSEQQRDAAPAGVGPRRPEHRAPAAGERHLLDRGGPQPAAEPDLRPGLVPARQ